MHCAIYCIPSCRATPTNALACWVWLQVEAEAYNNIALSLGVDAPSQILFATDNILEARAAAAAGWRAVIADRPGNAALPADCEFRVVQSMTDLLG